MSAELIIDHNAGFFSNCSVKLARIIEFYNKNNREPDTVDSSRQFASYKIETDNINEDVSLLYFSKPSKEKINFNSKILFHWDFQYEPYYNLDFTTLEPFVKKYFTPTEFITTKIKDLEKKYCIDYTNTVGVCYRGNDKHTETRIASYQDFFEKCKEIQTKQNNIRFFIQTDEKEFRDAFIEQFPNSFFCEEIPAINSNKQLAIHNAIYSKHRPLFGALFLSSVLMLSKCEHFVTHSGNCGIWPVLFRNNIKNVHQYLNHGIYTGWIKNYQSS